LSLVVGDAGIRVCAVAGGGQRRLCVLGGDGPHPVATVEELAAVIAAHPDAETLEELLAGYPIAETPIPLVDDDLVLPVRPPEVWAAGVTYRRSQEARQRESDSEKDAYSRVYDAERPELFLKATDWRIVGPRDPVGLRGDSRWQVPEPELGLLLGGRGQILGCLLGNDQTSRDIEGANTLYLPQAKVFAGSCALGPIVASITAVGSLDDITIKLRVRREGDAVYEDETSLERLRRDPEELVAYLRRDNPIKPGTVLLTGTGIVPPEDFALAEGDLVEISADGLGALRNVCRPAGELLA
jgi:2-dehydro-3-deoxy-D-arabinonate dehydratase